MSDVDLTVLEQNQNSSELVLNENMDILEAAATGVLVHDFASDADYTLSTTGTPPFEWQNMLIQVTDTGVVLTTGRNVIVPLNLPKLYIFKNDTLQTITIKTSSGTGLAVPTLKTSIVKATAADVFKVLADF